MYFWSMTLFTGDQSWCTTAPITSSARQRVIPALSGASIGKAEAHLSRACAFASRQHPKNNLEAASLLVSSDRPEVEDEQCGSWLFFRIGTGRRRGTEAMSLSMRSSPTNQPRLRESHQTQAGFAGSMR